jgi:translation initiation factor 3 subunit G
VPILISHSKVSEEAEPSPEEKMRMNLAKAGAGKVVCRLCKGGHFTAKCPYKDSLPVLDGAGKYVTIVSNCSLEEGL